MNFIDKNKREITLQMDEGTINAYHEGKCVGHIQFYVLCTGGKYIQDRQTAYPEIANVISDYQRAGIATKIIEYAKTFYDEVIFVSDNGMGSKSGQIHYSQEGLALKHSCERKGITIAYEDDPVEE